MNILYEDNHLLVVEKTPGILSQSDGSTRSDMLTLLKEYIKEKYHKEGNVYLGLVHRLDKDVGGIMVFARTSKAAKRLSEQIRNREFEKFYLAVVNGKVDSEGVMVDKLLKEDFKSIVSPLGKEARLSYQLLEYKDNMSLVKIKLETGRYHQIRVQFKERGHFLLGDSKYGKSGEYKIALYAYHLAFYHPVTKEKLTFELIPSEGYFKNFKINF